MTRILPDAPVSTLRQRLIDDMSMRHFSMATQRYGMLESSMSICAPSRADLPLGLQPRAQPRRGAVSQGQSNSTAPPSTSP